MRALVLLKRLVVWFGQTTGRFLIVVLNPLIPLVIAPIYQITRRQWRAYNELSEDPWTRRKIFFSNSTSVFIFATAMVFFLTLSSVNASTAPGVIVGSHSLFLTKLISSEIDWQASDVTSSIDLNEFTEQIPTTIYHNGGAVAYVFPYTGNVGKAPLGAEEPPPEEPTVAQKKPIEHYAVQRSDTLARIAKKFGLKIETLLWANNLKAASVLHQGDTIIVPRTDGVVYTVKNGGSVADVAKKFKLTSKQIALANDLLATAQLKKGQSLVIPGVQVAVAAAPQPKPAKPEPAAIPESNEQPDASPSTAPAATSETTDFQPVTPETPQDHPEVIQRAPLAPGEKLFWPTRQHSITQFFSGGHPGVDINGDYTDQVYAADDGTVVFSGWNNSGYGNMILIDHGNGMLTRYGHNSKVFVATGQQVTRGSVIAMVGTTGRSTGSHLHFEVIIGGRRVNPIKYIR